MNGKTPKISVVMSVYNGSEYLKESIESILNQSFADFEFIIINDASTDNSGDIIAEYAKQDRRIKLLVNRSNIGLTKSLNKGLKIAKGEYIARQDADDISLPHRFAKQVPVLESKPKVILVSCDLDVINSQGYFINKEKRSCNSFWIPWYLLFYNHIGGHSQVIFRKNKAIALGGYCEDYIYSQDYEFWCRLIQVGDMEILPEVLLKRREHGGGITFTKRPQQLNFALQISKKNLKSLIDEELNSEELLALKHFWSGDVSGYFPNIEKLDYINNKQIQISKAFLSQMLVSDERKIKIKDRLNKLIGKQFIWWIYSLSIIRRLPLRIKVTQYALNWNSIQTIRFWLQEIYVRPLLILKRTILKIYRKLKYSDPKSFMRILLK